jgi:hypothetical protein
MKRAIFAFGILVCCNLNAQSPKTFATKTNALDNFTGYKVAANARQLGTEYWENTNVLSDLMICVFQKNYEVFAPPQGEAYCAWTQSICNGDFNNDGYIDVFNSGTAFGGKKANLSFLIWNPANLKFEEKNLINDKTSFVGAPTKVSPIYLNDDNFVDLVIFGHQDESSPKNRIEPITVCISDGKGGYDLTELVLQPPLPNENVVYEHGSVADLNGDKFPDLFIAANSHSYIFWGIAAFPYFSNKDFVDMKTDFSFYTKLKDINKDGYNDIFIANNIQNKMLINNGKGVFSGKEINTPYPTSSTNTMNVYDYIVDDLNGDGLNDFININATNHLNWTIEAYIQQANGSFNRELSWVEYTLSLNRTEYRNKLIYYDFDGDGKKDITYSDTGMAPYTSPDNEIKKKTVFIRTGNKFIEKDFFQYDPYAKYLFDSLKGKPNCPLSYMTKPILSQSKLSFCSGDSTKISINNPRDTLKWYYGTKSDVNNVTSKTFLESTTLYVTRTDTFKCVISSDTITITKNALPALPTVKDTVFCQNISSSTLLATGTSGNSITWYGTNATGGTGNASAVVAPTTDTTTKSYYVSQINNTTSCESPRAKITVKINPAPASPSVKDTAYCNNISADTLKATSLTGHSLNWYGTNATGGTGTVLGSKPITTTVGSFNYYVSQKNNSTGCEGARAKIGVTVNPLPIAPVVRDTNYCNNATADTIRLNASTGATLLWYGTNATGGTGSSTAIKPSTATVGSANYYLSQIITATGCEGPRSKVVVTTKPIPGAPTLSRDTANFLLSGAPGTTWYKDGSAITDTAQKYKPTTAGSYTAKTTTNGCTSVMSAAYYYLVTDIINLSKDEFIKLAPNPFINQLNFDFIVKGYQKLNIEVYDVATGSKVATQQNITAGTKIQLGQLARGTYIVRVTSNDNKIAQQFKMVKL